MRIQALLHDETGFIVSAELLLVATIVVIGMIVGLSEVQHAITQELNDAGDAFGNLNQSFFYSGFSARKSFGNSFALKSYTTGSAFLDYGDDCDRNQCSLSCDGASYETPKQAQSYCSNSSTTCAASCSLGY